MAKITLQQKWNDVESQIESVKQNYLNDFLRENVNPEKIYRINGYEIEECAVTGFSVSFMKNDRLVQTPHYYGKKPSGWDVDQITLFYTNINDLQMEVYIQYEAYSKIGKLSGAYKYKECFEHDHGKSISFTANRDYLIAEAEMRRQKFEPREGYSPCAYCRTQTPNDKLIDDMIIGRGRDRFGKACITKTTLKFCSHKCAANEQMSREG